jgi:hypothetical protein
MESYCIEQLKFPDFCIPHGCRNARPLGQKDIIFTVFAMKTAKPNFIIPWRMNSAAGKTFGFSTTYMVLRKSQ